jgi:predicted RNase H-like HicB family nuclease/uncharacterized damage-inducible protein DinB
MIEYALYLESGPRRRTTMVHVLDLLGCIARGPTTEEALEVTPDAIRAYLRFLREHGEAVDPDAAFTTVTAEHVTAGPWIGYGDPTSGFGPDFQPLTAVELSVYLRRLAWLQADLLQMVRNIPREQLAAEPAGGARSLQHILEHVAEAHCGYVRHLVGKVDGLTEALKSVQHGPDGLPSAVARVWQITGARLEALTDAEREQPVKHGQTTWTARRALRRALEHAWEHLLEVSRRLGQTPE